MRWILGRPHFDIHFGIGVKGMASELHPMQHGFICSLSHDIALGSSIYGVE